MDHSRGLSSLKKLFDVRVQQLILTSGTKIGIAGLSALSAVLITSMLEVRGLGVFALFRTVPTILIIFTEFGLSHSYPYLINKRKIPVERALSSGLVSAFVTGIAQVIIWLMLSTALSNYLFKGVGHEAIFIAAFLSPLIVLELHFINVLRALGKITSANILVFSTELLIIVTLLAAYFFNLLSIDSLSSLLLFPHIIIVLGSIIFLKTKGILKKPTFDRTIFIESFTFGIKSQLGIAFQTLNYRLDHLILGFIANPTIVGIYVIATKSAEMFRFLAASVVFVFESHISNLSGKEAVKFVSRRYLPVFGINLLIISIGFFVGPVIIPFMFESSGIESILPFNILLCGLAVCGANGLIAAYNLGQGKPLLNTISIGLALIITVLLDIILIPKYGVVGAAVASSLAYIFLTITYGFIFIRESKKIIK